MTIEVVRQPVTEIADIYGDPDAIWTEEFKTAVDLLTRAFVWFGTHDLAPDPTWLSDLEQFVNIPRLITARQRGTR